MKTRTQWPQVGTSVKKKNKYFSEMVLEIVIRAWDLSSEGLRGEDP